MATLEQSEQLFEPSRRLIAALSDRFIKIDLHDLADPRDPGADILWLEVLEDNPLQEGEVIMVSREHGDIWSISHETANNFGGWPTHWDVMGKVDDVVAAALDYLR